MRHLLVGSFLGAALLVGAPIALAQDGSVKIMSPAEGAMLDGTVPNRIDYEVMPGARGDHVHLYLDGKEAAVLRKLSGSHTLEALPAGPHTICIKVVTKAHVPTGVEQCVKVSAR